MITNLKWQDCGPSCAQTAESLSPSEDTIHLVVGVEHREPRAPVTLHPILHPTPVLLGPKDTHILWIPYTQA